MKIALIAAVLRTIAAIAGLVTALKIHRVEKGMNGMQSALQRAAFAAGVKQEHDNPTK